jgi:hypothetical protein
MRYTIYSKELGVQYEVYIIGINYSEVIRTRMEQHMRH